MSLERDRSGRGWRAVAFQIEAADGIRHLLSDVLLHACWEGSHVRRGSILSHEIFGCQVQCVVIYAVPQSFDDEVCLESAEIRTDTVVILLDDNLEDPNGSYTPVSCGPVDHWFRVLVSQSSENETPPHVVRVMADQPKSRLKLCDSNARVIHVSSRMLLQRLSPKDRTPDVIEKYCDGAAALSPCVLVWYDVDSYCARNRALSAIFDLFLAPRKGILHVLMTVGDGSLQYLDDRVDVTVAADFEISDSDAVRALESDELNQDHPRICSGFADVSGLEQAKSVLMDRVVMPLLRPQLYQRWRHLSRTAGVLLYGPPGCGKTLLARSVAQAACCDFVHLEAASLVQSDLGGSERELAKLFRRIRLASRPTLLFVDEIDVLFGKSRGDPDGRTNPLRRLTSALFLELDQVRDMAWATGKRFAFLAATNNPWALDEALLRSGRLDEHVYLGLPSTSRARTELLDLSLDRMLQMTGRRRIDTARIGDQTQGYSSADLVNLCRHAAMLALEEESGISNIADRHFQRALETVKPSVSYLEDLRFKTWPHQDSRRKR